MQSKPKLVVLHAHFAQTLGLDDLVSRYISENFRRYFPESFCSEIPEDGLVVTCSNSRRELEISIEWFCA